MATQCTLTNHLTDDATPARELWREFKLFAEDVGQTGAAKMSLTAFTRSMSSQPNILKRRKRPVNSVKQTAAVAHFNLKLNHPTDTTKQSWKI